MTRRVTLPIAPTSSILSPGGRAVARIAGHDLRRANDRRARAVGLITRTLQLWRDEPDPSQVAEAVIDDLAEVGLFR